MNRIIGSALAASALFALLAGCSLDPVGVTGTVTGRHQHYSPATKHRPGKDVFTLSIGSGTYSVDYPTYSACHVGSTYPTCKN